MHLHFERSVNAKCDCSILSLTWMGKVPDELPEDEGWKLNRTNYYQEGWLATGNVRGIVGVTFTTSHCKKNVDFPLRTNYNLRGHRSEVILVKWNEPYQKLASCDSSGIIFVWIKYEGRWSIELINDRNTPVTHFSWSHDGRMALICYQDGFVLVGSVAGQRYWSSMLNLESTITCGIWTPDDQQVYFGTTSGQIVVMDVHGAMVSQVQLSSEVGISSMAWSCEKFKMEENDDNDNSATNSSEKKFVLAVSLQNGYIFLLKTFDDVSPIQLDTGLQGTSLCMEWSNSRELLAVAGTTILPEGHKSPLTVQQPLQYNNLLKFYTDTGILVYTITIPFNQCPVSALTWGHNDKRLFMATGSQVHIAWVSRRVASLQLMCRLMVQSRLRSESQLHQLPLPARIRNLIGNLFAQTIRCCVPSPLALREFVSRPPNGSVRLHCTMIRHDDDSNLSSGTCYTLYLEYLGGLVPLLKGKRTSKIRPEFVIFDPQVEEQCSDYCECAKSSGSSQSTNGSGGSGGAIPSDSSDSDREEGCTSSPRMQRRRRRATTHKSRSRTVLGDRQPPPNETNEFEDLAYIDTLPEHVRLVEVTSNIWGTKFKIHGLASSVPANLGQVTYKTSLLHLQPRQMTLVMTELRDDIPPGPDPNFNPNLFSEDEEEVITTNDRPTFKTAHTDVAPPIAPMSPRGSRLARPKSQIPPQFLNPEQPPNVIPALARAESYEDEFPYVDLTEMVNFCEALRTNNSTTVTTTGSSNSSGISMLYCPSNTNNRNGSTSSGRHAVSPLCCEGSVPALQSPKNAVAPSDIIFDRPPAQTLLSYSTTDFSNSIQQVKSNFEHSTAQRNGVSLTLNLEKTTATFKKKLDSNSILDSKKNYAEIEPIKKPRNCDLATPSSSTSQQNIPSTTGTKHTRRTFCNKNSPSGNQIGIAASKWCTGKSDELRFIDEDSIIENMEPVRLPNAGTGMRRTMTVMASPPCSCTPNPGDAMVRSCSVGYLDLVDAQLVPCDIALAMLRKETPKRLVLVNRKTRMKRSKQKQQIDKKENMKKSPNLGTCGKSKSLDSSDMATPTSIDIANISNLPKHKEEDPIERFKIAPPSPQTIEIIKSPSKLKEPTKLSFFTTSKTPVMRRKTQTDDRKTILESRTTPSSPIISRNRSHSETTRNSGVTTLIDSRNTTTSNEPSFIRTNSNDIPFAQKLTDSPNGRSATSLHSQALTTLENLLNRIRELDDRSTVPSSPELSTRLPRSSPASPAPSKKGKRNQSASPIRRHFMNSPLLGRRNRKNKNIESSDDEVNNASDRDEVFSGKNYKDLETFQKAQLRQKLKRGKIEPNGINCSTQSVPVRREFVMHNKAPMWNENSQVYQLDFGGRVTQESAKNFQIEFRGKQVMQFGRIDGNAYTLDFQYPFSALQAFAVALANVTQRLK